MHIYSDRKKNEPIKTNRIIIQLQRFICKHHQRSSTTLKSIIKNRHTFRNSYIYIFRPVSACSSCIANLETWKDQQGNSVTCRICYVQQARASRTRSRGVGKGICETPPKVLNLLISFGCCVKFRKDHVLVFWKI